MTTTRATAILATILIVSSLACTLSAANTPITDGKAQVRILADDGQKKKTTDLGPKRKGSKPKKAAPKTDKEAARQKKSVADKLVDKAKAEQQQQKGLVNHMKALIAKEVARIKKIRAGIVKMRAKHAKMPENAKKYSLMMKILRHISTWHTEKGKLKANKATLLSAKKENKRAKKRIQKKLDLKAKMNKVDPKTGKKIVAQIAPKDKKVLDSIRNVGHAQRAKLWSKHWGQKVSLAGNIKDLKVVHRFKACLKQKCESLSAWKKNACRRDCRKQYG